MSAYASFVRGPVEDDPDARPGWSRLAIASLVPGVIGFLWPVGLVLAVVALLRIRRTKKTAAWAAWTGLVLSLVWAALGTSMLWPGTSGEGSARTLDVHDLKPGDCFGVQATEVALSREVTVVPCDRAHHGEAFARADIGDSVAGDVHDEEAAAEKACAAASASYLPAGRTAPTSFHLAYVLPQGNTLLVRTHRTAVCAYVDDFTLWKGGLRDGATAVS